MEVLQKKSDAIEKPVQQEPTGLRDEKGRIRPGFSLNPRGRVPTLKTWAEKVAAVGKEVHKDKNGKEYTLEQAMIKKAWIDAAQGNAVAREYVTVYSVGKPAQAVIVAEDKDGEVLDQFLAMQDAELDAIIAQAVEDSRELIAQAEKIANRKVKQDAVAA